MMPMYVFVNYNILNIAINFKISFIQPPAYDIATDAAFQQAQLNDATYGTIPAGDSRWEGPAPNASDSYLLARVFGVILFLLVMWLLIRTQT
jgi:hypothetical protein